MVRVQRTIVAAIATTALAAAVIGVSTTSHSGLDHAKATAAITPVRAAFYYPWFDETWHSNDHYRALLGEYSSSDAPVLAEQVTQAKYAGLDAFISSWWGADTLP